MLSHYLDIMLRMPDIGHELHSRLLLAAHRRIASGDELAVSWPDWKGVPGEFGFLFRVFGMEEALSQYLTAITPMIDRGMVRPYPISKTPQTDRSIVFSRDNHIARFGPANTRRLKARAEAQGREFNPTAIRPKPGHHLTMQSTSTGANFCLYVRRTTGNKQTLGARNYGLGYAVPDF